MGNVKSEYEPDEFDEEVNKFDALWYKVFGENKNIFGIAPHCIFTNPLLVIGTIVDNVRWFYQRGVKGYDERATWDVGYFLGTNIPRILSEVKGSSYGIPFEFFPKNSISKSGDVSDKDTELAARDYDATIALIKWGFEEMEKLRDAPVLAKHNGIGLEEFNRRQKDAKEAMKLLIDYYWSIGD